MRYVILIPLLSILPSICHSKDPKNIIHRFANHPKCMINIHRSKKLVRIIIKTTEKHALPELLLPAVVLAESGGRNQVHCYMRKGIHVCDIGPGQINTRAIHIRKIRRLRSIRYNLNEAAKILKWSAKKCNENPKHLWCRYCKWGGYNPYSKTWCKKVIRYMRDLSVETTRDAI